MDDINVYFLYSSIIVLACFFSFYAEKKTIIKNGIEHKYFNNALFFCSFLVLVLFCTFTDTGVDYHNYYHLIATRHDFEDIIRYRDIEPLFTIWAHYGMQIFDNEHLVIVSMKVVTLVVMFSSFYIMRREMSVFIAVCAYASISYLTSFSLIRIILASSFITLAFVLLMKNKNIFWIVVLMTLGIGLHFSCIMAVLAIFTYYFGFKYGKGKQKRMFFIVILVISILISFTQLTSLMNLFIESSDSFEHYQKYVNQMKDSSFGMLAVWLISYSLVFYMIYKVKKVEKNDSRFFLMLVFTIFSFVFEYIGSKVPVMERAVYNYISVYCIVLPYCFQKLSVSLKHKQINQMRLILIMFFVMRFYFVLRGRAMPDSESQLYYYHFFNPFE